MEFQNPVGSISSMGVGPFGMKEKYGYPVLSIDRPYAVGTSGQLRTRIQAFVESLEIKRINAGRKL